MNKKENKIGARLIANWISLFVTAWVVMVLGGVVGGDVGFTNPGYWIYVAGLYLLASVVGYLALIVRTTLNVTE